MERTLPKLLSFPLALLIFGFLVSATARGTSFAPPEQREIKSPNGLYLLRVDPKKGKHEVFSTRFPKRRLWSFTRPVWHHDYHLSDDGKRVVWVAWSFVMEEDLGSNAIEIWSAAGLDLKTSYLNVGGITKIPRNQPGPIGDSWRIWRDHTWWEKGLIHISQNRKGSIVIDPAKLLITRNSN